MSTEGQKIFYHSDYDGTISTANGMRQIIETRSPLEVWKFFTKQGLNLQPGVIEAFAYLAQQPDVRLGQVRTIRPKVAERARQLFKPGGHGVTLDQMQRTGMSKYFTEVVHTPGRLWGIPSYELKMTGWEEVNEGHREQKIRTLLYDMSVKGSDNRPLVRDSGFVLDPSVKRFVLFDDNSKLNRTIAEMVHMPGMAALFQAFTFGHYDEWAKGVKEDEIAGVHRVTFNSWSQIDQVHSLVKARG